MMALWGVNLPRFDVNPHFSFFKGEQQQQSLVDCFYSIDGCNCGG